MSPTNNNQNEKDRGKQATKTYYQKSEYNSVTVR